MVFGFKLFPIISGGFKYLNFTPWRNDPFWLTIFNIHIWRNSPPLLTNNWIKLANKNWMFDKLIQRHFPWYLAPGQVLLLHVWGIFGTPGTVGVETTQKRRHVQQKSTNIYVAEVRIHTMYPPKKEGFKDEILESHIKLLNITHFQKKDLLQVIQHGDFFAGVPSMATTWTFASVGAFHCCESWISRNSCAMKIKSPRPGAVSSTSSHCTQRLRKDWVEGCPEKSL